MDISKKILSDPINRWVFETAKKSSTEVFLVGGYIRNVLCGKGSRDRDFILKGDVKEFAKEAARRFNGTFVEFKNTYRVVLKPLHQIDFSCLKRSIHHDLRDRDFTINAIAWSYTSGITDPFGGCNDITHHLIRAVRLKNLLKDPLRMLRAYRLGAELGFKIEQGTRHYIRQNSKKIRTVAKERITEELFKLLSLNNPISYLIECYRDDVLRNILIKGDSKKIDNFSKNIKKLDSFEDFIKKQQKKIKDTVEGRKIIRFLNNDVNQGLNTRGLLRLAILIKGYPISNTYLRVSKRIKKAINELHKGMGLSGKRLSDEQMYKIFKVSGERVFESAILLSFIKKKDITGFYKRARDFQRIRNKVILDGYEIQRLLSLRPSVRVGYILERLQERRFKGKVRTKRQAVSWILSNFT
jgi:tRNA nucleotidyltransferase/poly(A) polymerase